MKVETAMRGLSFRSLEQAEDKPSVKKPAEVHDGDRNLPLQFTRLSQLFSHGRDMKIHRKHLRRLEAGGLVNVGSIS